MMVFALMCVCVCVCVCVRGGNTRHVIAEETRSFWRDPAYSPSKQGYHWGHNAESYWLIGQAMASGMLKMLRP